MDKIALRRTFGRFATGVTIVTCNRDGDIHGMTANSFTSVSLDPALVLVSIDNRARMAQLLQKDGHFGLNILSLGQTDLSNHFAGRPAETPVPFVDHEGVPLIEGALAHLVCEVREIVPAGDHSLFIGEVIHHEQEDEGAHPLLFYSGSYRELTQIAA